MLEDGHRARVIWDLHVGSKHGEVDLPTLEAVQRLGSIGRRRDRHTQAAAVVGDDRGEPCRELSLDTSLRNREGYDSGVGEPGARGPDGKPGQKSA